MATRAQDWLVSVYDEEDAVVATWQIENRTEQEASDEAATDIEREYPDADWTLSALADKPRAWGAESKPCTGASHCAAETHKPGCNAAPEQGS